MADESWNSSHAGLAIAGTAGNFDGFLFPLVLPVKLATYNKTEAIFRDKGGLQLTADDFHGGIVNKCKNVWDARWIVVHIEGIKMIYCVEKRMCRWSWLYFRGAACILRVDFRDGNNNRVTREIIFPRIFGTRTLLYKNTESWRHNGCNSFHSY